ncbi:hypothetical protein [Alcaligenes sp. SDU_A2]|uniref:hypothetical protein n=1 Tax=Alcaligenes sp. SDU_A2 TaxID=3136634 RepID=UPI00311FD690
MAFILFSRFGHRQAACATLSYRAGLYWLDRPGVGAEPVQLGQVWRSPWWLTVQWMVQGQPARRGTLTVWRTAVPQQAWWALRLRMNRLALQVRVQNKDIQ